GTCRADDLLHLRTSILKQINAYRQQQGVGTLRASYSLMSVAQAYAYLEAQKDQMGHNLDGQDGGQRMSKAGYRWTTWGENVGYQYGASDLATTMVQMWIKSPPHHANIVNGAFTETGVGVAKSRSGKYYFCQVFAHPAGSPSRVWIASLDPQARTQRVPFN